jgi:FMN phosphatase YigB (HAD superfamily)
MLRKEYNTAMIRAIIFDADGPLYEHTGDASRQEQALLQEYGYHGRLEDFKASYEKEKWKGYVAQETVPNMFRIILASVGVDIAIEEAKEFADSFDTIHKQVSATPDAVTTLKTLKDAGYLTCVLTDSFYSAEAKWPWFEQIGLRPYLDDMVSSLDIRKLKATPEAYRACLDKLGVLADESIFVGHQQYEMDGAKAAHVKSVAILPIATPNITADYTIDALAELPNLFTRLNDTE